MGIDASRFAKRNHSSTKARRKELRSLLCENLERREMMAVDSAPRLLSVATNTGEILSTTRSNLINESPRELVFRFDSDLSLATLAGGLRITGAGGDGTFGAGSPRTDVRITPAYLNFGDSNRIVIARFSQQLADDLYRVEAFGVDLASEGATAIRDTTGLALSPRVPGTDRDTYQFDLELGTKITAIVPQPIDRVGNALVRRGTDIEVYFSDDELYDRAAVTGQFSPNPSVVDPQYYNLILTKDTVSPNDDLVFKPTSISYDPVQKRAILTFASDIENLPGVGGSGTFRLRVGSNEAVASLNANKIPSTISPLTDPGSFLSGAVNVGAVSNSFSTIISEEIRVTTDPLLADYPGSNLEPGHRDIQDETHLLGGPTATDTDPEIATIYYSFMENQSYGVDAQGRALNTSISEDQKQRVREIFEFYGAQLGVDFVEHLGFVPDGSGILKFVVGDMAPLNTESGLGGVLGVAGSGMAIIDNAENWDNGFGFGTNLVSSTSDQSFFTVSLHEIGHLLGLGHAGDLPASTFMANPGSFPNVLMGQIFPGPADTIHGQHLFRPDNRDADLYRFDVQAGTRGVLRAETIAERLTDSSRLDTYLTLFRKNSDGSLEVVAANNNYFSDDSMVQVELGPGEYYLQVTGKGNEDSDPGVNSSGSGAVSQGRYDLRIDFKSTQQSHIVEEKSNSPAKGSALDGDGDGLAGGNFDFWFRAAPSSTNTNAARTVFVDKSFTGTTRNGTLSNPFNSIAEATATPGPANQFAARAGDIIRLVGDNRTPNNLLDDRAYEIGNGGPSVGALGDGQNVVVPRGVTLMIDAGAILKFGGSRILVGSNDSTSNRSEAAIQVLGTPTNPVYFTSFFDETLGRDTNVLNTAPRAGDWGGIEIRNDFDRSLGRPDREREGIFLNTISNAEMRYGGGTVGTGPLAKVVSPIELAEARPLIMGNRISRSADAAISADPNSFEETLFSEPRYQNGGAFIPDYTRIGPDIRTNQLTNNSINGLFVRIDTLAGNNLEQLTVPGRMNDSEITIVLGENLVIGSTPGGAIRETVGPDTSLLSFSNVAPTAGTGFAAAMPVNYLITYVDAYGQESLPSAQMSTTSVANQAILLSNIPAATLDYVSRRIWRQDNNTGTFKLVATLNKTIATFTDNGGSIAGVLPTQGLVQLHRARLDASLVIDPGVVIKSFKGRIELGISSTLIAEGSSSKPVVFTSRLDDRYGAAGTFDTNNDGLSTGTPGDWSGILSRHLGNLSIDNALIAFGGGDSRVPGGSASFNAVEIHQSDARIANSRFENNDTGAKNPGVSNRDARGKNEAAVIFVLASQPVLINNIIQNNNSDAAGTTIKTAAISIDANSLNSKSVRDSGRMTGLNQRQPVGTGNYGPLVANNQLGNNSVNGMRVRGDVLASESVWDDTDIVHVLQSEITIPDYHTYGGLRLTSKSDESLVVKMNNGAGFTATGRPLDIKDRIGGSLQILGAPGFPVVLTSLADDTIGAGFDFRGNSVNDTNNDGSASAPQLGEWRSIRFEQYANDRNVDMNFEREPDQTSLDLNSTPATAQELGILAPDLRSGDENLRYGTTISGSIANQKDVDVFQFSAFPGTPVWFDIDQTSGGLDTVIELIDVNGNVLALSDNSIDESTVGAVTFRKLDLDNEAVKAYPMDQMASMPKNAANGTPIDFLGVNPLDAGLRVVLPGTGGLLTDYYVRVRSSNVAPEAARFNATNTAIDPTRADTLVNGDVLGGKSSGSYKLQLRLQQTQEVPGSTVRYSDIRYATVGIEALGLPMHSPLVGEYGESNPNETSAFDSSTINIGNILSNDRGAASIAGNLASATDIDWYDFVVERDSTQQNRNGLQSVTFDIDYADGYGRANTQLWVFQIGTGRQLTLVAMGNDSNITDDQPGALQGSDTDDLNRGSNGHRDAYIGPLELPAGNYVVAVSNASVTHASLDQFTSSTAFQTGVRLEPLDSVRRIFEDRFDRNAPARPTTNSAPVQTAFGTAQGTMSQAVPNAGNPGLPNAVPFNLSDVTLFVATNNGTQSRMQYANALTGAKEAEASNDGVNPINLTNNGMTVHDIAVSPAGRAFGTRGPNPGAITDANSGSLFGIDIGDTGAPIPGGAAPGLTTFGLYPVPNAAPVVRQSNVNGQAAGDGMVFTALTFSSFDPDTGNNPASATLWGVGSRRGNGTFNETPLNDTTILARNVVFRMNPDTGAVIDRAQGLVSKTSSDALRLQGAATDRWELGSFNAANGIVTGLATINNVFFGVTNQGELVTLASGRVVINDPATGNPIAFTGLSAGPRNVENGRYANLLFGITAAGRIYAFNTAGVLQNIFPRGAAFVDGTGLGNVAGIDFSSLDVNLWHASDREANVGGHGRLTNFNNSRETTGGDLSLKFGYSDPNGQFSQAGTWSGIYNVQTFYDNFAMPGGAMGALESDLLDLTNYSANDQPVLYFNYATLNQNSATNTDGSNLNDGNAALDTFRVYGAGEDGQWILLATNNTGGRDDNYTEREDEFDVPITGNQDAFGRTYPTTPLWDGQGWRQARVNMAPFAGQRDVRLRFEFSTGGDFRTGDPLRGGQELTAVPGERLKDGDTFAVGGRTFEFDLGLVLNLPSGASLQNGSQINVNGTIFTYRPAGVPGPNEILFNTNDTPAQIAQRTRTVMAAAGLTVTTSTATPNVLNISGLNPAGNYNIVNADPAIIIGRPGVAVGAVAVNINNSMTATQVRDAIRVSLAAGLNVAGQETNVSVYRVKGNSIVLHGVSITNRGPLGATTSRSGDAFGPLDGGAAFNQAAFLRAGLRTQTNQIGGTSVVQIDDLVLGFAERGEVVIGATASNVFNPTVAYEDLGGANGAPTNEIETGTYQLEIRTSADYGTTRNGELRLETTIAGPLGRTFDTNDRLSKSFALRFNAPSQLRDGATFTLSDGVGIATFEFDVTTSIADPRRGTTPGNIAIAIAPNATRGVVARAIRNAINSVAAQRLIKITAKMSGEMNAGGGDLTDPNSIIIHLDGQVAADLLGKTTGFTSDGANLTLVTFGADTTFGEDGGDQNVARDQGQLILASNSITYSRDIGINIDAAPQQFNRSNLEGNRPYPGVVRNLVTLNSSNVAPGVVVMNNVVAFTGNPDVANAAPAIAIAVSGDTTNTNGRPPLTVARIFNNTLYGYANLPRTRSTSGIVVSEGAIPTLLNNIVANFNNGVVLDPSSSTGTVINSNIYQGNVVATPLPVQEANATFLTPAEPLFINGAGGRFYLAPRSKAIDSSVGSLEGRPSIEEVKNAIGLPPSSLLAPLLDLNGLKRADDPDVSSTGGQGQNVFIDRGALERVDSIGPKAVLMRPLDDDALMLDSDRFDSYVRVQAGNYSYFEFLLNDFFGSGVDEQSVVGSSFIVTENGRELVQGSDYFFGYSGNNRTVRLTPLAGFWRTDSVYEITLINKPSLKFTPVIGASSITDGTQITVNKTGGGTAVLEYESGYMISVPKTLTLKVPAAGSGPGGVADGQTFRISNGPTETTFEFDTDGTTTAGNRAIPILPNQTAQQIRDAILAVLGAAANANLDLALRALGTDEIQLGSKAVHAVDVTNTTVTVSGVPGGVADGQTFSFTPANGRTTTFEFNVAGDTNVTAGNIVITFSRTATNVEIAGLIATALSPYVVGGFAPVKDLGNGTVYVGGKTGDVLNLSSSALGLAGNLGVSAGAIPIVYVPDAAFTDSMLTGQLVKAFNSIGTGVKAYALAEGVFIVEGANSVTNLASTTLRPIVDLAANQLQANRPSSLTQFTIVMPEVQLDYGDALQRPVLEGNSSTLQADNGARHGLFPNDVPVLAMGRFADSDVDGRPSPASDADDFSSLLTISAGMPVAISNRGPARLLMSAPTAAILGRTVTFTDPLGRSVTYQFTNNTQPAVPAGRVAVDLTGVTTANGLAIQLQQAVIGSIIRGDITGIFAIVDGNALSLGGTPNHTFDVSNSGGFVNKQRSGDLGLNVSANVSSLAAGQTLTIQDGSGNTLILQVVDSENPTALPSDRLPISIPFSTRDQASLAAAIVNAINGAIDQGRLRLPKVTLNGATINLMMDDEDGVRFEGLFNADTPPVPVVITSTGIGYVDAWIDWNQNNVFEDGEQVLKSEPVRPGENTFLVVTPQISVTNYTTTAARFRLSATGGLLSTGMAVGGEVEDYTIEILRGKPPTANNDPAPGLEAKYRVNEDTLLTVSAADGLLVNDSDADGDLFRVYDSDPTLPGIQPLVQPQHGTLTLNADGSFQYQPDPDYFGTDTFVYQLTDPRMVANSPATVTITVTPVNDAPVAQDDLATITEDTPITWPASLFLANDSKGPANESTQQLRIKSATLINPTGRPNESLVFNAANGTISFTPGLHYNTSIGGRIQVRLVIEDFGDAGGDANPLTDESTLSIDILPINDAPLFNMPVAVINLTEDPTTAQQTFASFFTGIAAGPAGANDELANQTVTMNIRALDTTRFATQPTVSVVGGVGTLSFVLAPNVNSANSGPILVEVWAEDNGPGTPTPNVNRTNIRTITINVTPVNDAPEFVISTSTFDMVEDAPRTVIPSFLSAVTPGPATAVDETGQVVTATVTAVDPSMFLVQPRLNGLGDLEFQLNPDVNSLFPNSLNILVTVTDDGNPNASTTKTLTLNVQDVNDAPSFNLNPANVVVTVNEDNEELLGVTETVIADFIRNLRAGPATALDELSQTLTFTTLSVSNPTLFSQLPTFDTNGNMRFHTAPNRSGQATFAIRLTDSGRTGPLPNSNLGPTATFTIVVQPINDAPEFTVPSSTTVNEDQGVVSIPGFATGIRPGPGNAVDESSQELTFLVRAEDPRAFAVLPTIQADGTLVFQTAKDVNNNTAGLSRRVFVSLRDNGSNVPPSVNQSGEQTFTLNITPVNDPPIPDSFVVQGVEDTRMTIQANIVLNGDAPGPTDEVVEGQQVRLTQIERTTDLGGTVIPVFEGDRIIRFDYVPPTNFVGNDIIRYVVTDNGTPQQSATGLLTISLSPVNDAPEFTPGETVTVQEDSVPYSATWATNILAGPVTAVDENSGPTAQTVSFETTNDNNALFAVQPTLNGSGVLTFTLAKDANGRAVVDVVAVDSGPRTAPNIYRSGVVKLTIVVSPVNDAPGFQIIGDVTVDEDSSRYTAPVLRNIVPAEGMNSTPPTGSDEVGQTVTLTTTNNNTALFAVQPTVSATGVLDFTPAQDAFGTAIVSVIARDNGPNTPPNVNESVARTFTIVIRPVNDAPVANNDRYATGEDTVLTITAPGVLANDRDVDMPADTITVSSSATTSTLGAIVTIGPDGSLTYDSRQSAQLQRLVNGQTAQDTFTYTIKDAAGVESNLATVTVTVSGDNDVPVAVNDIVTVPFGVTELINVLANDTDVDSTIDPRTVEIGQLASHGTATALSTGRIEYRPNAGYRGPDSFTYRVRDAFGALSNEATVTITVNTAPVALPDSAVTVINTPVTVEVLRNDSDPDGTLNPSSVQIVSGPDVGTAVVLTGGSIRYTPPTNFVGTASLQYVVSDSDGLASNVATVTFQVVNSLHQNPSNNLDVNADGFVSPIDVLILINDINFNGSRVLPNDLARPPYMDVNGDGALGPLDVLQIINFINTRGNAGAGEGEGESVSMADLGYSQINIVAVPPELAARAMPQDDEDLEAVRDVDLAVLPSVSGAGLFGPLPMGNADQSEDDVLTACLASEFDGKDHQDSLDSVFADEDWLM